MDELLLRNEVGLVVVELLEQPLPPIAVLVEEEQEVLQVDLALDRTIRQVAVHQVQDEYLLVGDCVGGEVRMRRIFSRA